MKIACIIPARGGSKGIPGKNIRDFCGKPLIQWSIEQALACSSINEVYVTTENKEIALVSLDAGALVIDRPAELATDTVSIEPVIAQALEYIKRVDIVIHLQPTSPLRIPDDIDKAIETFLSSDVDTVFSATTSADFCLWRKDPIKDNIESFTFDYLNRGRRQDRKPLYLENGSIYIFRYSNPFNFGNRIGGKIGIYDMPLWQSFEIDELEDWNICESLMRAKILERSRTYEK